MPRKKLIDRAIEFVEGPLGTVRTGSYEPEEASMILRALKKARKDSEALAYLIESQVVIPEEGGNLWVTEGYQVESAKDIDKAIKRQAKNSEGDINK